MPKIIKKFGKKTFILGLIFILTLGLFVRFSPAKAASLTKEKDLLSDSRATTVSNHTITFVSTTAIIQSQTIIIKPDAAGNAFNLTGLVVADIDLAEDNDGNCDGAWTEEEVKDGAADADEWGFAVNTTDDEITLSSPTGATTYIAAGYCVQIEIGANATYEGTGTIRIINPATGSYDITITNTTDTGVTYVAITTSGIAVTATVGEYLTFTVGEYATEFGSWTAGSTVVRWADDAGGDTSEPAAGQPIVLTIASNSTNGISVTARSTGSGAAAGLYDSVSTNVIDAVGANGATAPVSGTEGYALYLKNLSGTNMSIDEGYDDDVTSPVAIQTTADEIIANTAAGGVTGTVDLALKAAIAGTTQAGSYADTIILVATPTY
jgi:hypothetical protein